MRIRLEASALFAQLRLLRLFLEVERASRSAWLRRPIQKDVSSWAWPGGEDGEGATLSLAQQPPFLESSDPAGGESRVSQEKLKPLAICQ